MGYLALDHIDLAGTRWLHGTAIGHCTFAGHAAEGFPRPHKGPEFVAAEQLIPMLSRYNQTLGIEVRI
jgi:hypothetical protein